MFLCTNSNVCISFKILLPNIQQIASSMIDAFNALVFVLLILVGICLFLINQIQVFRKLKDGKIFGVKLSLLGHIYNLVAVTLIVSIFLH